jgi:hypothetical protein
VARSKAAHIAQHASAARRAVAEHAWQLVESGLLSQLVQLSAAMAFLPGGLSSLLRHLRRRGGIVSWNSVTPHASVLTASVTGSRSISLQRASLSLHRGNVAGLQARFSGGPRSGGAVEGLGPAAAAAAAAGLGDGSVAAHVTADDLLTALDAAAEQFPVWRASQAEADARVVLELLRGLEPAAPWLLALSLLLVNLPPLRAYAMLAPQVCGRYCLVASMVVRFDSAGCPVPLEC